MRPWLCLTLLLAFGACSPTADTLPDERLTGVDNEPCLEGEILEMGRCVASDDDTSF